MNSSLFITFNSSNKQKLSGFIVELSWRKCRHTAAQRSCFGSNFSGTISDLL